MSRRVGACVPAGLPAVRYNAECKVAAS